jgi:uncharacterized protein (TIGR02145 family)
MITTELLEGRSYKVALIGNQTWMAENLNYDIANVGLFYDNDQKNYKYGKLYDYVSALTFVPEGWRLPSNEDWEALIKYVGCKQTVGARLKANSEDDCGFSALLGGFYNGDKDYFYHINTIGWWWSSTINDKFGCCFQMFSDSDNVLKFSLLYCNNERYSLSVRYMKNSN